MLEERLHEQAHMTILPSPSQPAAPPTAPPRLPTTTPASPMHGTVLYSTTLNMPPSHSGSGAKICPYSSMVSAPHPPSHLPASVPDYQMHHGAPIPCAAAMASATASCAPSTACMCGYLHGVQGHSHCGHSHGAQGHTVRLPLADAANVQMSQQGATCMQSDPGCWNSHALGCSGPPLPTSAPEHRRQDLYSGRHRSSSLIRMQRLQDRLKASERDLSYRLGRLLGREADALYSSTHA